MRWKVVAVAGFFGSWLFGYIAAGAVAMTYDTVLYPPDPDPIRYDVALLFFGVWFVVGSAGSWWFLLHEPRPVRPRSER